MANFERKSNKFLSDGVLLSAPSDLIPRVAPTKYPILVNVRQYTRGVLESRAGLGAPINPSPFGSTSTQTSAAIRQMAQGHTGIATTITVTFPSALLAGSVLVAFAYVNLSDAPNSVISDTGSNAWISARASGWDFAVAMWYCLNSNAGVSSVTVSSSGTNLLQLQIYEIAGWAAAPTLTASGHASATSSTPSVTASPSAQSYAISLIWSGGGAPFTAGTGWGLQQQQADNTYGFYTGGEDKTSSPSGSLTATFGMTASAAWGQYMLCFSVPQAPPPIPSFIHSLKRLNDPNPGATSPFARLVGASTNLYLARSATPIDSAYSGNPLSIVTFRPPNSPEAWAYIADSLRMRKVRADGTNYARGVAPPLQPPTVAFGTTYEDTIDDFVLAGNLLQGPNFPSAATGWTNSANAEVADGNYATIHQVGANVLSAALTVSGFGFSVPATSQIVGVLVESLFINLGSTGTAGPPAIYGQYSLAGVTSASRGDAYGNSWPPTTLTWRSYGGPTDLWGAALTPAIINSASFGVNATIEITGDSLSTADAGIDVIRVTVYYLVPGSSGVSAWTASGTAGSIFEGARVNTTVAGILYDSGTSGWASVNPASLLGIASGARLMVGTGGNQEVVTVRGLFPAIPATTIQAITYDSGSTGMCTIQPAVPIVVTKQPVRPLIVTPPTPAPSVGPPRGTVRGQVQVPTVPQTTSQHLVTEPSSASQIPPIQYGTIVRLNAGGGTDETVRVLSISVGPDGNLSFRCSTAQTHAAGESLTGESCFRARFINTHGTGEAVTAGYLISQVATGVGNFTKMAAYNLAAIGGRPTQPGDEFHISILVDNLSNLIQGMVELDVDAVIHDFAHNYYYYPFLPNYLTPAVTGTLTQLATQQTALQNAQIQLATAQAQGEPPEIIQILQQQVASLSGQVVGNQQTGTGASQWTELRFKVSDLIPVGTDLSRNLSNVAAVRVSFNCSGPINIQLSSFFLQGTYGPDVGSGSTASNLGYYYCFRGRSSVTGARSNASPGTRTAIMPHAQQVVVNMTQHPDPQIDMLDVFRFGGTLFSWLFLGSTKNTPTPSFNDEHGDANIANSSALEFDNFQPWPIVDQPRKGTCNTAGTAVTWVSGDAFNVNWAPGSLILINGIAYTLYQQPTSTLLQTVENIGTLSGASFELTDPVILGQPLPFFWGPYGEGETALYGFACGDLNNQGTLYITKGNNFDSTSDAYQFDVTSPSEALQNGCMYGTQPYVFSTERDFQLFPSFTGINLFQAQPVASGDTAGLYAPWGLAVGKQIYKIVKDGIVASTGGEPVSITGDLYPLFPHDGQPGVSVNGYAPPDMTQISRLRLACYDGLLYFDYVDTTGASKTLVYDEKTGGWSADTYTPGATIHYGEEGQGIHSLLIGGFDGNVYQSSGTSDNGQPIAVHVRTPSDDQGDSRGKKLYGDIMLDYDAGGATGGLTAVPQVDNSSSSLPASVLGAGAVGRVQSVIDVDSGLGQLNRNLCLDLSWSATQKLYLYEWQPSYVQKVEDTFLRATDYQDAGYQGNKFVQGIELEADTNGLDRTVQILYDCGQVGATLTVNHGCQKTVAYSFNPPFNARLLRISPTDPNSWRLYSARWIWQPAPESVATWQTQMMSHCIDGYKHIREFWITLNSTAPTTFTLGMDGGKTQTYTLPSTGGEMAQVYFPAQPNKSKLYSYGLASTDGSGIQVYGEDSKVYLKSWREGGPYQVVRPIGGASSDGESRAAI